MPSRVFGSHERQPSNAGAPADLHRNGAEESLVTRPLPTRPGSRSPPARRQVGATPPAAHRQIVTDGVNKPQVQVAAIPPALWPPRAALLRVVAAGGVCPQLVADPVHVPADVPARGDVVG